MVKYKLYLLLAIAMLLAGCHSDPEIIIKAEEGKIEDVDGIRITIFHLLANGISHWQEESDVSFELVNPESRKSFTFSGSILNSEDSNRSMLSCRLRIGETEIPNGTYYVSIKGIDLSALGLRKVRFINNIGTEEEITTMDYSDLDGSGTSDDPYLISSGGDFLILLSYLQDDPEHAYGRYFKQTRPFDLPHRSQVIDGAVWAAVSFSGNYDGGGYRLRNLTYQGASDYTKDSGIGLFKDLYCATISNVTLSGALITHASSNVGLIAGSAAGGCRIENVAIEGTILVNGSNVGGLIGDVTGDLEIKNITINSLAISGDEAESSYIGMLVGSMRDGNLTIDGVSTPDHIFSATGRDNIGGVIGYYRSPGKVMNISNVVLQHTVDQESSSTKIISGDRCVGGLIGEVRAAENLSFSGIQLKAPVTGSSNVGGIAGELSSVTNVNIEKCVLSSVVSGRDNTGGFFGYIELDTSGNVIFRGEDNSTRYVVKSSATAEVEGSVATGGIIGTIAGSKGKVDFQSQVEIAVNVSGVIQVGGAIGLAKGIEIANVSYLNFSSKTMKVTASSSEAGGILGYGVNISMYGGLSLDPVVSLPDASALTSNFSGVVTAFTDAGGIVGGLSSGTIKGLVCAATVTSTATVAGGILGNGYGTVSECAFKGTVSNKEITGGIVGAGYNNILKIQKCINYSDLSDATYLGGILGYFEGQLTRYVRISECYNFGDIKNGKDVGGIAGCINYGVNRMMTSSSELGEEDVQISRCGNQGKILGCDTSGQYSAGGVAGTVRGWSVGVLNCSNSGDVSSTGVQKTVGGVVGYIGDYEGSIAHVSQCMNTGTVTSDAFATKLGGVAGHLDKAAIQYDTYVEDCCNWGALPTDQKSDTGGILGYAASYTNIERNFNRGMIGDGNAIVGTHNSGTWVHHDYNYFLDGTGKDWPSAISVKADKLTDQSVYKTFNFKSVWRMTENGPVLRNCPFQKLD